jgi:hypothetical protein
VEHMPRGRQTRSQARRIRRSSRATEPPRARLGWIVGLVLVPLALVASLVVLTSRPHPPALSAALPAAPMLGSSTASTTELTRLTSEFGHMPIVRVYYPGLPPANAWTGSGKAGANSSAVVVSFKALPSAILSGADDNTLKYFFDSAPTTHPIYYSYYHEPEDNIAAAQFSLADYKAAWAHVVALAKDAHNPQLHSTLILMAYDLDKSSGRNWHDYLPSGGIISTLGWDAYPAGAVADVNPQLTPPGNFMGPAVAASKSVGLPFGFAEFGVPDVSGRPGWLNEVGSYIMKSGAVFGTLFKGAQMADSGSIAAWHGEVTASVTQTPVPAPPTSPAPSSSAPSSSAAPTPSATATASASPTATPAPTPTASPAACTPAGSPSPGAGGPQITGLAVSPADLVISGKNHVSVRFTLSQGADVTVCLVNSGGSVARRIARPTRRAGQVTISYYGYDGTGHRLPAGSYVVQVVASNSQASSITDAPLTLTDP